jgi:hypothetical protein
MRRLWCPPLRGQTAPARLEIPRLPRNRLIRAASATDLRVSPHGINRSCLAPPNKGRPWLEGRCMMMGSTVLNRESPMHGFIHHLALALVLFHMTAGCCLHHAHAECLAGCQDSPHWSGCCSEDEDHHPCPAEKPHRHSTECDGGECVFVVPETDSLVKLIGPFHPLVAVFADRSGATPTAMARLLPTWLEPSRSPPLRLHLLNQVLLV